VIGTHLTSLVSILNTAVIASGGNSSLILLHELHPSYPTTEPVTALVGHHANVCTLAYSSRRGRLISSSWDCAARIWRRRESSEAHTCPEAKTTVGDWECEKVLSGHSAAVWGVAIFEEGPREGCFITGELLLGFDTWYGETILNAVRTFCQDLPIDISSFGITRGPTSKIFLNKTMLSDR
jgi:WD40 repeat protein